MDTCRNKPTENYCNSAVHLRSKESFCVFQLIVLIVRFTLTALIYIFPAVPSSEKP